MLFNVVSRSGLETMISCPRRGYYGLLYRGGFDGPAGPDLVIGLTVHKGLETLFKNGGHLPEAIASAEREFIQQLKGTTITAEWKEHLSLAIALLTGWKRVRWDSFHSEYDVLAVELETRSILAPGVTLAARADLIVREKATGRPFVWNWKTASDKTDFALKWYHEVQMWTEALATEDHLGERVEGCIVEGLFKGGKSTAATFKGSYTSPLVCGYIHEDGSFAWKYTSAKGWKRFFPANAFPGGIEGWVNFLPAEVVNDQFARTPPILKNDEVVRGWIKQIVRRVMDIQRMLKEDVSEEDRLAFFTQNWGHFRCSRCPFSKVCHLELTIEQMVELGLLVERVDHHRIKGEGGEDGKS